MKSPAFETALDAVYGAFAAPTPRVIEGCPCCLDTRKTDILLAKPLRELSGSDLARYASGVFYTVGGVQDFRYLLPRMLELVARDPAWHPSAEIVIGKLKLAGWREWGPAARSSLTAFLDAWFDAELEAARDLIAEGDQWGGISDRIDELLCGLARAGGDLGPWLERLQQSQWRPILRDFALLNTDDETGAPKMRSGFWDGCPEEACRVLEFLAADEVRALLS